MGLTSENIAPNLMKTAGLPFYNISRSLVSTKKS